MEFLNAFVGDGIAEDQPFELWQAFQVFQPGIGHLRSL